MAIEQTLILVKPDAVRRGLIGEITRRFERKGLRVAAMKMMAFDEDLARLHYDEHVDKGFFPDLLAFITSGPVVALVLEGNDAIALARLMMGKTKHTDAAPGTIRGDFATETTKNLVHGSDSPERAKIEIELFFESGEIF